MKIGQDGIGQDRIGHRDMIATLPPYTMYSVDVGQRRTIKQESIEYEGAGEDAVSLLLDGEEKRVVDVADPRFPFSRSICSHVLSFRYRLIIASAETNSSTKGNDLLPRKYAVQPANLILFTMAHLSGSFA